jgi:hypothetical protein
VTLTKCTWYKYVIVTFSLLLKTADQFDSEIVLLSKVGTVKGRTGGNVT